MQFHTHVLSNPLDNHLESIFHFSGFTPDHSIERVVPTGHIFILFELDGIPRNTLDNHTLDPVSSFTKVWISGMHRNYISISAPQNSEMFVIQFKPHGAFPFLHFPIEEINDKVLTVTGRLGDELLRLRNELLTGATSQEKFASAERWLRGRYLHDHEPPLALQQVIQSLQNRPEMDFGAVLNIYPYSQKHLIQQFKKYVGLTPKYYQRILRFNSILQRIHQKEKIPWAQIAYQSGLSDQSHFIKEFRHFSGFNPQEFITQDSLRELPNFFPLNGPG